jgi:hypothetical protein
VINLDDIKQLVNRNSDQVLSLYLRTDAGLQENQATTPAWRIKAKNMLRDLENSAADDKRQIWKEIRERAEMYLEGHHPQTKGLVLFYGPDFDYVYELPVWLDDDAATFGDANVAPLLWLVDEYEPYLIVLVDTEEAHFLKTYLGNMDREEAMASDRFQFDFYERTLMPRTVTPRSGQDAGVVTHGSQRDNFEQMMDEMIAKFYRQVADRVGDMREKVGAERIVIGGTDEAAHAVYKHMHESLKKAVVGVISIPFHETDQQVMERVLPAALEFERKNEMEIVEQVIDFAKSGGRGALGVDDVLSAVDQQRVELLVVPWPLDGASEMIKLMTTQVLQNNGQVELVHGAAADRLKKEAPVAARLYYGLNNAPPPPVE